MIALLKAFQVILALSILIFIHELGHFVWAKIFKIKVEKFYLFFDIGGKALVKWKWGETEFGIGWLPLGGYCKISGMVDESMDMEQLKQPPRIWEFRSRPAWQRLLVMAGGVINNFIFAIAVYCLIMGIWGSAYIPNRGTKIYAGDLAREMGFRTGDEILAFDDYTPDDFGTLQIDLARRRVRKAKILRGSDTLELYIDQTKMPEVLTNPGMFDLAIPFVVDSVMADSPNHTLCKGDRIIQVDSLHTEYMQDAKAVFGNHRCGSVDAKLLRGADTLSTSLSVDSLGRIGVYTMMPRIETRRYNALEAIPAGLKLTGETIGGYIRDLGLLVNPDTGAYKSVGSFIAIGEVMPDKWDWYRFMYILALLSIMLGVMNLLPIPGLDGGHILFTLFEMVSGRKPSDRFLYIAQIIGMVLLAALMILAFSNDIGRLIK